MDKVTPSRMAIALVWASRLRVEEEAMQTGAMGQRPDWANGLLS